MKVASHSYLRIRTDPQKIYISAYLECAPFISLDQDTVLTVNKDTNLNSTIKCHSMYWLSHNANVSFSKTRYRQCVVYGAKTIQFIIQKT